MFSYAKQWRWRLRALVLLCATQALNSNRFMVGDRDDPNKYTPGLFIRGFHDVFLKGFINGGFFTYGKCGVKFRITIWGMSICRHS